MKGIPGILGTLAVAVALLFLAAPASAANSVAYQVNVRHSGYQADANLDPPFQRAWAHQFRYPTSYPLIVQNRVFLTTPDPSGPPGTTLYALSLGTGRTIWQRALGGYGNWSGIAFGGGQLYAVTGDGVLTALNPGTGAVLWRFDFPDQAFSDAAPTYSDGLVYVSGTGEGGTFYAVTPDGKLAWAQSVQNGDQSSPAVGKKKVFASYACAQTYAFNRINGSQVWHWDAGCEGGGGRTAVLHRGRLYVRDFRSGYVLNAMNGNLVNIFESGPSVGGPPPAFRGTQGFITVDGELRAFDAGTESTDWTFTDPEARTGGAITSAPIVLNGDVLVGSSEGELYALKVATGHVQWHADVGAPIPEPDEQNLYYPLTGLGAGQGTLVVPAGARVVAYRGS